MKKSKLIMPIVAAATTAAAIAPALALSGCSTNSTNAVEVVNSASKTVAKKSAYATFKFKQSNLKDAESTKVKIANLKIDGAEAASVSGLIKSTADSAGNIVVRFNMDLARTQYGSSFEKITFDLQFTNKQASTSYTLTGFSVAVDTSGWAITYTGDDQVTWNDENPTSVYPNPSEDVVINYGFNEGYKTNAITVTINGTDKTDQCTTTDTSLTIPKGIIDGEISVNLTSTKITYTFTGPTDTIPGVVSVTPTGVPTWHEPFVMTFKLEDGYRLSWRDFNYSNILLYTRDTTEHNINAGVITVGDYDATTQTQTVTIAANYIAGNIWFATNRDGPKTYAVSYETTGATITSPTTLLTQINEDNLNKEFITYTIKDSYTYADPVITANGTTLTKGTDYTVTTASPYTIKFINYTNMGPNVKINLNIDGNFGIVENEHNLINTNTRDLQLKAKYGDDDVTTTAKWTVESGSSVTVGEHTGIVSLSDSGKKQGGSATILCEYTPTGKKKVEARYKIEVGSFDRLDATSLAKGEAKVLARSSETWGDIVIPSGYYNGTDSVPITTIPDSGFYDASYMTSIHIPATITSIGIKPFDSCLGLGTITVDSNNTTYSSPANSNCIIHTSTYELCAGCKGTVIPTSKDVVTTISSYAFTGISLDPDFTIPANISEIKNYAFADADTQAITFANADTRKFIQTTDSNKLLLDISTPDRNAQYLADETSTETGYNWWQTGIITDDAAAKYANIEYIDEGFNKAGVTLNRASSTGRVVNKATGGVHAITLAHNQLTTDVVGKITISGNQEVWSGIVTLTGTGETLVTLTATEWAKITTQEYLMVSFEQQKTITNFDETGLPEAIFEMGTWSGGGTNFDSVFKQTGKNSSSFPLKGKFQFKDDVKGTIVSTDEMTIAAGASFNIEKDLTNIFSAMTGIETTVTISFVSDTGYAGLNYDAVTLADMTVSNETTAISNQTGYNTVSFDVKADETSSEGSYKFVVKDNGTEVFKTSTSYDITSTAATSVSFTITDWSKITGHELTIEPEFQAKTATVQVDSTVSTSFGTVTIKSGASLTEKSIETVVLTCTATADITGKMVLSNTSGTVIESAATSFTAGTATDVSITLDTTAWGKVASGGDTLKVTFAQDAQDTFCAKYDEWVFGDSGFVNSTMQYDLTGMKVNYNGTEYEVESIDYHYDDGESAQRFCAITYNTSDSQRIADYNMTGAILKEYLLEPSTTSGVTYSINSEYIQYDYPAAPSGKFSHLKINKYGYIVERTDNSMDLKLVNVPATPTINSTKVNFDAKKYTLDGYCNVQMTDKCVVINDKDKTLTLTINPDAADKSVTITIKDSNSQTIASFSYTTIATQEIKSFDISSIYSSFSASETYTIEITPA